MGHYPNAATSGGTSVPGQFTPETYGAVGDLKVIADAVMTSGQAILTSATANFTAADVGKSIIVNVGAASANQAPLITTILSFQSATQVTLAANAPAGATGNPAAYGTDDTAAVRSAWSAAQAYAAANPSRTGEMYLTKIYVMSSAPLLGALAGPNYGYSMLPITVPDTTGAGPKMNAVITTPYPADELNYWEQFNGQVAGAGLFIMRAAPATDATWGIPSVIGGPTAASGSGWSLTGGFANIRVHVDDVKIIVPYNPGWIGVDARFLACATGTRYGYQMFAVGVLGGGKGPALNSVPGGSWNFNGAGIRFPVINNNDLNDFESITCEGVADSLWIADHVSVRKLAGLYNANGIVVDATLGSGGGAVHGSWFGYVSLEAQTNNLLLVQGTLYSTFPLNIGLLDSENSGITDVTDTGILTGWVGWYNINTSAPIISGSTGLRFYNHRLNQFVGHLGFGTQAVTAAAGANAGGSPPAPVVTAGSNDPAGNITFGTGTGPGAGAQVVVTFNTTWAATPHIVVSAANAATQPLGLYVSAAGTGGFTLSTTGAPAASQANTVYSFNFVALG